MLKSTFGQKLPNSWCLQLLTGQNLVIFQWEVFNRIFRIPTIFHFIPILYDVGPVNLFTPKNSKIENIHLMLKDPRHFPHTSN